MELDNCQKREVMEVDNGDKGKSIKSESGGSTVCGISYFQLNGDKTGYMALHNDDSACSVTLVNGDKHECLELDS